MEYCSEFYDTLVIARFLGATWPQVARLTGRAVSTCRIASYRPAARQRTQLLRDLATQYAVLNKAFDCETSKNAEVALSHIRTQAVAAYREAAGLAQDSPGQASLGQSPLTQAAGTPADSPGSTRQSGQAAGTLTCPRCGFTGEMVSSSGIIKHFGPYK
jgi:hypothetical protein